jgi:hypothetical protein
MNRFISDAYIVIPAQAGIQGRSPVACPDRGREMRLGSHPPPSEPDVRISRIRLSG